MIDKHNVYGKSKMKERVFNHCYVFCLKTQFLSSALVYLSSDLLVRSAYGFDVFRKNRI